MPKSRIIATIAERFSHRRETSVAPVVIDEESERLHEELEDYNYNRPYYAVAKSIQMCERATEILGQPQTEMQNMVIMDAHDLAVRVLPPRISDALGLSYKHPDDIGIDYVADSPPSLRALHLLLHAYDVTHDPSLRHVVTFIIQSCPPKLSELHREAYEYGAETNKPIISSLQKLAVYTDDKLDEMR